MATVNDDPNVVTTNAYFESNECGTPRTENATNVARYSWLGANQRSSDDLSGVILMGVRLYNPQTGRFLSVDPVAGGNENAYVYPGNPIDQFDLDGHLSYPHRYKRFLCHGWGKYVCTIRRRGDVATLGYNLAAYAVALGASCGRVFGMTACWNSPRGFYSRRGTTVGDVYFTGGNRKSIKRPAITHEKIHRQQWRDFGLDLSWIYFTAGIYACTNFFEQQAGLVNGGYKCRSGS